MTEINVPWSALSQTEMSQALHARGLPAYRSRQLFAAIHKRGLWEWESLTEFPASLRIGLAAERPLRSLVVQTDRRSSLDGSRKILFQTADGNHVESVLMLSGRTNRTTICVSAQVGCPAACTFCASGLSFTRNLTAAEISDQIEYFAGELLREDRALDNIVYMGMGEPFLNYARVMESIAAVHDPAGLGVGARRFTVSTVGIVPAILRFADDAGEINLAVSLHAPNDELRSKLVPYNRRFPIADIIAAVRRYTGVTRRRVSFEYVLLQGTNDSPELAYDVAVLLRQLNPLVHLNVIPWNPFPGADFDRATRERAESFRDRVIANGVNATIRYSKGLDIDAACGQLRQRYENAST